MTPRRRPADTARVQAALTDFQQTLRQHGITVADVCRVAGVPIGTLYRWRTASRQPLLGAWLRLQDALALMTSQQTDAWQLRVLDAKIAERATRVRRLEAEIARLTAARR